MLHFIFTEEGFRVEAREEELSGELKGWWEAFRKDRYQAMYQLGFTQKPTGFDPVGGFLCQTADCFFRSLTSLTDLELTRQEAEVPPNQETLERLMESVPFAIGAEYVSEAWIKKIFRALNRVFAREIASYDGTVSMYLAEKDQNLRVPERIFFHLVESGHPDYPFAFLATYATKAADGGVRHVPLKYALEEYENDREKLLKLLACLNRASEVSGIVRGFVESGEMFHTLRLTAGEAYEFLKDIPQIEKAGILCRIPNWWRKKASGVSLSLKLGEKKPSFLGFDALVSVKPELVVDGIALTEADIRRLLAQTEGLAFLKGKWIEVDHRRLQELLNSMEQYGGDVSLLQALQGNIAAGKEEKAGADVGPIVHNGKWLAELLQHLRRPSTIRAAMVPKTLHAELRPYQKTGYTWLNYMSRLGFGACLADDMGLGKTVQVLAFLEKLRTANMRGRVLLIVPASLLGNWQKETEKFAPGMTFCVLHGKTAARLGEEVAKQNAFLTITTYGMAARIPELEEPVWDCIILDEAQAIKNPSTRQTRQIKKLRGNMRIAMTGTPIENDLTNLWSLFDFLNKGLLGSSAEFHMFCKGLNDRPEGYAKLKSMISPFLLRRLKSDKNIISDLPEKWETVDYVKLSKKQVVLYRQVVAELETRIRESDGIERRGIVLAAIMKLKQICNHPDHYLGQSGYAPADSGKFEMLRELCETIYEKRERVLVFTQFKEITEDLANYLAGIFHTGGYVIHGGIPAARRTDIVEAFQGEDYVPFLVLSVKAGGTGLNLTGANHVIHFDRWWNPAVENQATDRAYRIGQEKQVMVHKLVCEGTIEEKIDALIRSKTELAEQVIGSGGENWITELSDEELMSVLRLDQTAV